MSIRVAINHSTEYHFDRLVGLSPHVVRLRPAPHTRTPVHQYSLRAEPADHFINWQQDPFGNFLARFVFPEKTRRLRFDVEVIADLSVINPFDFFLEEYAEQAPFKYAPQLAEELAPYLEVEEGGLRLQRWLGKVDRSNRIRTVDFLVQLNRRLHEDIAYTVRFEPGVQSCEQTLERGIGSCRDTGWLLVQVLRHMGLAARFVSGYLVQLTADQKSLDGPSGPETDFTDLHAWAEVFLPGAGWVGLDPTSGLFAGEGHIPLACTPRPSSAAPISGHTDKCEVEFEYRNVVTRIHEDPRVTKPYTQDQWSRILNLGDRIDARLLEHDVRLTLGGEPTFVSIDDMDSPQWSTDALGEDKRRLAGLLLDQLQARFAPGGVKVHGQGKWYPGEELPRWAYSCYWREDGEPLWIEPRLIADPSRDYRFDLSHARALMTRIAAGLGVSGAFVTPGFEDVYYYLWREGTLPVDVDPLKVDLKDNLERRRLASLLERGLEKASGYVLPLRYDPLASWGQNWVSGRWPFRRERLYLLPGDSPMGYRLPLDSVTASPPEPIEQPDSMSDRGPLPPRMQLSRGGRDGATVTALDRRSEPRDVVRTALCVEPRDGRLHVFLPPLTRIEQFLQIVAVIETAAKAGDTPVLLEGYEPPPDPRVQVLRVTPDPGVIEVNIHPQKRWRDIVRTTEDLYEIARNTRLGTEKFMLDGRHTGTGGGNHVTLGGPTPADSPLLRRPDLLRSLLTYWQHHPALSYLFSGAFIGPTSQAPRVDEARHENLYELEIAFQQLAGVPHLSNGESTAPWAVDRALRHLLTDLTGNTHRSEFCIDKLYSPDGPAGRQGLVEFRAFEMPPHAQMSAVQMLLLRSLVARFWEQPYEHAPRRWGTELHDRFMLPWFVQHDLSHVLDELQRFGADFELAWFAPFLEFRFPRFGSVVIDGVELTVNAALEPWHVLGEEMHAGGTARFVDSSVERVQICARGVLTGRHALMCNGRRVPLHPTGTAGEYVAGVRFKAWDPPSGLHPQLPRQPSLVFDLVDIVNAHALGGCTYHVAHPGGLSPEDLPVNEKAAEARRLARYWPHGHTQGPVRVPPLFRHPSMPYTLDLRFDQSKGLLETEGEAPSGPIV